MDNRKDFGAWLQQSAQSLGARSVACLRMDNPELRRSIAVHARQVEDWIASGRHGEMDYLHRTHAERSDPWRLFPFARSVIVLTFANHWHADQVANPFPEPGADAPLGFLSAYARGPDYHSTGQELLTRLKRLLGADLLAEGSVDSGAVYERLFALAAGLGGSGGNNLLRDPVLGTRVFIACLFVDALLPEILGDPRMPFPCEGCRACSAHCPTGAIEFQQAIDARRCISYLTIEKKGLLSRAEGGMIGDWLFGCDGCTRVCPPVARKDLRIPVDLEWLLKASSSTVAGVLKGTACHYAGVTRLRRNAVVVLKNMATPKAGDLLAWVHQRTGSALIRAQIEAW
ncbi:MAG: epoxyqueuosine reductase [Desulfuromonadales bacterium]|nr:epoxyqueuosine reductase [Desulfuromonadales bacterium]MBN2791151.1 epoxyqueuosine reductase [Desulfuromonadales bacterium]